MNTPDHTSKTGESIHEVYILKCADGSYFIGHTGNMLTALKGHMAGRVDAYTSTRLPVTLEFVETFDSLDDALARKKQLQGWSRKKKEAFIVGGFEAIKQLNAAQRENAIKK